VILSLEIWKFWKLSINDISREILGSVCHISVLPCYVFRTMHMHRIRRAG